MKTNSIEEIADILEVTYRIAELQGYNKEDIEVFQESFSNQFNIKSCNNLKSTFQILCN